MFEGADTSDGRLRGHFPFRLPVFVPTCIWNVISSSLVALRLIPPRPHYPGRRASHDQNNPVKLFERLELPMDLVSTPLLAVLFLAATQVIGRQDSQELHDGIIGTDLLTPIHVIAVFLALGYISNHVEASGLIKYLGLGTIVRGGGVGHRLFFYLHIACFCLGIFFGTTRSCSHSLLA